MNRKILIRNSSICHDDTELNQGQCNGNICQKENALGDVDHSQVSGNFPDVVSYINTTSQSHDRLEDCNDPDIVRSNSSSDEKGVDAYALCDRRVYQCSKFVSSSVSSFSSSDSGKHSTSSYLGPERKLRTSIASSVDDDDEKSEVPLTKGSSSNNCLFNQDSVFVQTSENLLNQPQHHTTRHSTFIPGQITPPIIESESSLNNVEKDENLERAQKARNRFSSSGYGTGSGGSAKGQSASRTSVHVSQESFSERNAVRSQGTQTSILENEEPSCVKSDAESKSAQPGSTDVNVFQPSVQIQTEQRSSEPSSEIHDCYNITSAKTVLVQNSTTAKSESQHLTCDSIAPLEPHTSEHIRQQPSELTRQQSVHGKTCVETSFCQAQEQPHLSAQSLKQSQTNVDATTKSNIHHDPCIMHEKCSTVYADSLYMSAPSFLRDHTISGSIASSHFPASSSSGSCYVRSSVEERWLAEPSPMSLMLCQSVPGASETSAESRFHLESLEKINNLVTDAQVAPVCVPQDARAHNTQVMPHFEELLSDIGDLSNNSSLMMSSLECEFDNVIMEKLQRSVRCHEVDCDVADCAQIQMAIEVVQNPRNHVDFLCEAHKLMLLTMFSHTVDRCDHPKCPFPWCGDHIDNSDQLSPEQRVRVMKQRIENFADHFLFQKSPPGKYMKLTEALPYDSIPAEGQDWIRLCMMGNSRRALLVQPVKSDLPGIFSDNQYWVIKKVSTAYDGDNWGLYSRLRNISHKSVATLLWAASFDDHMLVCSLYEGFTLHECLPLFPRKQLRCVPVFAVILQLMSAVSQLNSLGIAYLSWTSKNILVACNSTADFVVKLGNFSCSVLLESTEGEHLNYDGGHLLLALPRHIITPELRDNVRVEYASDVWGLGCLLHELVTGDPIWYEHRHTLDSDFKILTIGIPPVPSTCPELVDVFTACWEIDSSKRIHLSDLEIMVINALQINYTS